jgi:c-di-GMP-related signal transduction protein
MPLPEVLAPLAIADTVRAALLEQAGDLGALLQVQELAEQGRFDALLAPLAALRIDHADFDDAQAQATLWMAATLRETQGGGHG